MLDDLLCLFVNIDHHVTLVQSLAALEDSRPHEPVKPVLVPQRMHARDLSRTCVLENLLVHDLAALLQLELDQVVNDADMVNELVALALKLVGGLS